MSWWGSKANLAMKSELDLVWKSLTNLDIFGLFNVIESVDTICFYDKPRYNLTAKQRNEQVF